MEKSIERIEKIYQNKKNKKRLTILINKYYLAFLSTEKVEYIKKAYLAIQDYLKINKTDLDMILLICFFSLELRNLEQSKKFLSIIQIYKKYLKTNEIIKYSFYIYLKGLEKTVTGQSPAKYIKILEKYTQNDIIEIKLLKINLNIRNNSLDRNSIGFIKLKHIDNFWVNLTLYQVLEKCSKFLKFEKSIFMNYIKWGYKNYVNIENSINKYQTYLNFDIYTPSYNKQFYQRYKSDIILEKICQNYIQKAETTEVGFFFCKQAVYRQIDLEGLAFSYIKGCYKFNIEDIKVYPIKKFLQSEYIEFDLMAFIFYIILKDKKYIQLVIEYHSKILQYAKIFLEKKYTGIYYYSIYRYLLENLQDEIHLENEIIQIIYPIYYTYEITFFNEQPKFILIKDKEFSSIKKYEIKDKKAYINAVSSNFLYYIFNDQNKQISHQEIKIQKLIQGNSTKIALKFYNNFMVDKFTLVNLGKYFLSIENIPFNSKEILLKILKIKELSVNFKIKIYQLLGNIYFKNKDYENAVFYYKKISEKDMNDKYIGDILFSYISCFENERAIQIIKNKAHILPEQDLYIALRTISENPQYDKEIAPFIYEMLIRGRIDNLFIDIVLNNYNGGLFEWLELRKVLEKIGALRKKVDELILEKTIYTHNLNFESEKIFAKVFYSNIQNIITEDFLNYCIYESIFNKYYFLDETIKIMEHIFMEYEYEELGYALAHIYFYQEFDLTEKEVIFDKIIYNMEKAKINFEIFEQNKDKLKKYTYLFKNTPFIYNALPNKDIYFFYKEINQEVFNFLKMKYFKFGIYICTLPIFFGEEIEYYFSEKLDTAVENNKIYLTTNDYNEIFEENDEYFKINNQIINNLEGRYHATLKLIEETFFKDYNLKGKIL